MLISSSAPRHSRTVKPHDSDMSDVRQFSSFLLFFFSFFFGLRLKRDSGRFRLRAPDMFARKLRSGNKRNIRGRASVSRRQIKGAGVCTLQTRKKDCGRTPVALLRPDGWERNSITRRGPRTALTFVQGLTAAAGTRGY